MGLFKGLGDKPYTKADYYREMEERAAAKLAAKVAPVVVVPIQEPDWLETENKNTELSHLITEEIVVPFIETSLSIEPIENEPIHDLNTQIKDREQIEDMASEDSVVVEKEKPVKVTKQRRKKT